MKKIAVTGVAATILGAIGIVICCIPIVSVVFAGIGLSLLFLHKLSFIFVIGGVVLIIVGIFLTTPKLKEKKDD